MDSKCLHGTERYETGLEVLRQKFADRFTTGESVRAQHANTLTWIENRPADAVIFAETTNQVAEIVKICQRYRVPIVPFGAGTSLEGHVNASSGGVCLDLSRMDRLKEVNGQDCDCVVEAGLTHSRLNKDLRDTGLFFSVDPGTDEATLGGMASTRASGTMAVRYGTMRDNVINLTAVMADGEIVRTARRARKSSAGYDLTHLLVGSEGTLGIITELTLRLHGLPESVVAAVCPFENLDGACRTVIQAIQLGLGLARVEFLDEVQVRACNAYSSLSLQEAPTLFLEFHGTPAATGEQIRLVEELANDQGALRFEWAENGEQRKRLWKARHDAYWAARGLRPNSAAIATDVCVPISNLAQCVAETRADIDRLGLIAPIVGHVGDGNFHVLPLVDMADAGELELVNEFLEALARRAIAMDGTCTGEHGVGTGKIKYMEIEHGPGVAVMRQIKTALDPNDILNPGKILPPQQA